MQRSARKVGLLASRLSRSLKVSGTDTDGSATCNLLLVIHSRHGAVLSTGCIDSDNDNHFIYTFAVIRPDSRTKLSGCKSIMNEHNINTLRRYNMFTIKKT